MKKLGSLIPDAIGRRNVVQAARAQRLLREWHEIVGAQMAARSRPDRYEKGTIFVACEGPAWAQELRMSKDRILNKLNQIAGEPEMFVDIRFGVRKLPDQEPKRIDEKDRAALREALSKLTISEIAERRLRRWQDEEGTRP